MTFWKLLNVQNRNHQASKGNEFFVSGIKDFRKPGLGTFLSPRDTEILLPQGETCRSCSGCVFRRGLLLVMRRQDSFLEVEHSALLSTYWSAWCLSSMRCLQNITASRAYNLAFPSLMFHGGSPQKGFCLVILQSWEI